MGLECPFGDASERGDGEAENLITLHLQIGQIGSAIAVTARNLEQILVSAVGMDMGGENSRFIGRAQHHGAGAIAEEHAGGAVTPVEEA